MRAAADVVNTAIHKAIETGARVNIVRQNDPLMAAGGMAAILRY
jgi:stalled ribosome rescue protein Dom34